MNNVWYALEFLISFTEMSISCYFASVIFDKKMRDNKKCIIIYAIFPFVGALLLSLRENGILQIPDYVPAVSVFFLFSYCVCHAKVWAAFLWAVVNYFLLGINSISLSSILAMIFGTGIQIMFTQSQYRIIFLVVGRLSQLLITELILRIIVKQYRTSMEQSKTITLILAPFVSIVLLVALWNMEYRLSQGAMIMFNLVVCLLLLAANFFLLFFFGVISKNKEDMQVLKEHNKLIEVQLRGQHEISEMYQSLRTLRHDMNAHLHTIFGYIQFEEYQKASIYINKLIGDVNPHEHIRTGNLTLDALLGSKADFARRHNILVDIDATVPQSLSISEDHLSVVVGNLFDNSIDACMKIQTIDERFITIRIRYNNGNLLLYFENATISDAKKVNGIWLTTKTMTIEHGYGLKSIDRIVEMYGGFCRREIINGVFVSEIRLPDVECDKRNEYSM